MTYYTYLWLREDGTPYYVGKGKGNRAFQVFSHKQRPPRNAEYVLIQGHPSEEDAIAAEIFLIDFYGRKDLGTGILRNMTAGGEGCRNPSKELCELRRKNATGKTHTEETKAKFAAIAHKRFLGNTFALGIKRSEETRRRMRESSKITWSRNRSNNA